jgi:hypothetical protein
MGLGMAMSGPPKNPIGIVIGVGKVHDHQAITMRYSNCQMVSGCICG